VSWKVTVRQGSSVGREKFASLDEALAEARRRVEQALREERLQTVHFLREFTPEHRVQARIEISGPGLIRGREGGIDVLGDGSVIAYTGAIRKEPIDAPSLDEGFERLRDALSARGRG
jgi:hypothetical protein